MPRSASAATEGLSRDVWVASAVVVVGVIMSILDTTIVNVALDTLSQELDSSLASIQWVSTGYLLSLATVIPLSGWMAERFGAKRVWMTSVAVFGACSALCGLAWSDESLIFFRVLQGFGGGMIMPVGMTVLAQAAGPKRVGRVMSVIGVPMLLGPILGPVLGGFIVTDFSWRWIFYVNVPVAALALALAHRFLDPAAARADAGRLDWRGFLLLSPGLGGIVFGLSETETHGGLGAPIAFGPILAGIALVSLFVWHAWLAERPLIDVKLFVKPGFGVAASTTFLLGAALFGTMIVLPLYYQVARGESALTAGLLMAPQGVGAALAMPPAGRLVDTRGGCRVPFFGIAFMTAATLPFAFVSDSTPYWLLGGILVLRGIGLGFAFMPTMATAYSLLESAAIPRATSSLNAIQRVGGSLGTALLAVILQHEMAVRLGSAGGDAGSLGRIPDGARAQFGSQVAAAFAHTFIWSILLSALALLPAAVLAVRGVRARRTPADTREHAAIGAA